MSTRLQKASKAITALLQVADRAGLLKPEERDQVLDEDAFLGVSYATIYRRLCEFMIQALATPYEHTLPTLEEEWPNVEPHLRLVLNIMAERSSRPLNANQGFQLLGMLMDGHWQHVYRHMVTGLVWIILNEDADGSM